MENVMNERTERQSVVPYFMVQKAADFIRFAQDVFDAELISRQTRENSEDVIHAEIRIALSRIFVADSGECGGQWISPLNSGGACRQSDGGKPVQMFVYVDSADETCRKAVAAGATILMEPYDDNGGRMCGVLDPFQNIWWLKSSRA